MSRTVVDDAMVERACEAFYSDPDDKNIGWHNLLEDSAMSWLIDDTRKSMRDALEAAIMKQPSESEGCKSPGHACPACGRCYECAKQALDCMYGNRSPNRIQNHE